MRQPVGGDPLRQCFRQAVADALRNVGIGQGIEGPDQMIERHPRLRLPQCVAVEIFAGEFRRQIACQIG